MLCVVQGRPVVRVFISHAGRDRAWAEWVASVLRSSDFRVELDVTDWAVGDNFIGRMSAALERAEIVVSLWSAAYFNPDGYSIRELEAAVASWKRVVPLRVEAVIPPALWRTMIHRDIFDLDEKSAAQVVKAAISHRTGVAPRVAFPDVQSLPRLPSLLPQVWNIPARSPVFTGRDELLIKLRESLRSGGRTLVHALQGIGGVGKTLLAVEYAHRFVGEYDLAWWIDAERSELIGEQLTHFAIAAGIAKREDSILVAVTAANAFLRRSDRWLLIFDNAPTAADVVRWVPQGCGHVIITSRSPCWTGVATMLPVDVFSRKESVSLLRAQIPALSTGDADWLAEQVGDLPLALAQATGVMTETGMPADEYVQLLASTAAAVLDAGTPVAYPASLAGTVRLATARLDVEDPAAGQLIRLLAMFGPEPVPLWLLSTSTNELIAPLADVVCSTLSLRQCVGRLARFGLARVTQEAVVTHRLTQAVIRDDIGDSGRRSGRAMVEALLEAARPADATDSESWTRWAQLLPHILATDPSSTTRDGMRDLVCETVWYQYVRGDARAALPTAEKLRREWRRRNGNCDYYVLFVSHILGVIYQALGQYDKAHQVDSETINQSRQILGEDHPGTLASANSLGVDLRELGHLTQARKMHEVTLERRRRVLGEDHPDTLVSASSLGIDLHALGDIEAACKLDWDTLERRRRVLGEDHPDTLVSAGNYAADLHALGKVRRALELDRDTLERRRRVLGEDHPDTLASANSVGVDLRELSQVAEARDLHEATLERRRRILGQDHPDTLATVSNLIADLQALGEIALAEEIQQKALSWYRCASPDEAGVSADVATPDFEKLRRYGQLWRSGWR